MISILQLTIVTFSQQFVQTFQSLESKFGSFACRLDSPS